MVKLPRRLLRSDADIAYGDSGGDGVAVVLTHGAGLDHSTFEVQAATLERSGYRVITWDLRAHGQSILAPGTRFTAADALADLDALLVECNLSRPALVGHSLGGNLAQAFAHDHPERTGAVIVLDSTWNTGPLTGLDRLALRFAAPALSLVPASRLPGLMARASAVSPDAVARAQKIFARMPKTRFLEVWRATVSLVDPDPRRRFPVPLALVRGARDGTGNIAAAMPRWAAADDVPEIVIPDAGHIVSWDAPEQTSHTLIGMLDQWNPLLQEDRRP